MMKKERNENAKTSTYQILKNTINTNLEKNIDYTTQISMADQGNVDNATYEIRKQQESHDNRERGQNTDMKNEW